jgi:hypothetical protein
MIFAGASSVSGLLVLLAQSANYSSFSCVKLHDAIRVPNARQYKPFGF